MLIRPPTKHALRAARGTTCDRLVGIADVMPTCLELAGAAAPAPVDGSSLLTIQAENASNRLHIGNCSDNYFLVMRDNWKYHWYAQGGWHCCLI